MNIQEVLDNFNQELIGHTVSIKNAKAKGDLKKRESNCVLHFRLSKRDNPPSFFMGKAKASLQRSSSPRCEERTLQASQS
jgi:hypothetical protein